MKTQKSKPVYKPLGKGYLDVKFIPESNEEAEDFRSNPDTYLARVSPGSVLSAEKLPLQQYTYRIFFATPKGMR